MTVTVTEWASPLPPPRLCTGYARDPQVRSLLSPEEAPEESDRWELAERRQTAAPAPTRTVHATRIQGARSRGPGSTCHSMCQRCSKQRTACPKFAKLRPRRCPTTPPTNGPLMDTQPAAKHFPNNSAVTMGTIAWTRGRARAGVRVSVEAGGWGRGLEPLCGGHVEPSSPAIPLAMPTFCGWLKGAGQNLAVRCTHAPGQSREGRDRGGGMRTDPCMPMRTAPTSFGSTSQPFGPCGVGPKEPRVCRSRWAGNRVSLPEVPSTSASRTWPS